MERKRKHLSTMQILERYAATQDALRIMISPEGLQRISRVSPEQRSIFKAVVEQMIKSVEEGEQAFRLGPVHLTELSDGTYKKDYRNSIPK